MKFSDSPGAPLAGLVFTSLCLKRKNCSYQMNDPSPLPCENPETQEAAQVNKLLLLRLVTLTANANTIYCCSCF